MNNEEKRTMIQGIVGQMHPEYVYYELLEQMGDLKGNYHEYMKTAPINCDEELKRIDTADYDLCAALFTMILREDHFANGSLRKRFESGKVDEILNKMTELLK